MSTRKITIAHPDPRYSNRVITPFGQVEFLHGQMVHMYPTVPLGELKIAHYLDGIQGYTVEGLPADVEKSLAKLEAQATEERILKEAEVQKQAKEKSKAQMNAEQQSESGEEQTEQETTQQEEPPADKNLIAGIIPESELPTGQSTHNEIDAFLDKYKEAVPVLREVPSRREKFDKRLTAIHDALFSDED